MQRAQIHKARNETACGFCVSGVATPWLARALAQIIGHFNLKYNYKYVAMM